MIKIGIFGGAFNPPHNGHVNLAKAAFEALKLDKLLIIPTAAPPHKQRANVSFEDRAEMCRLAFGDEPKFEISDIERHIGGKSYTLNTVKALKELYPKNAVFYLIIGGDMLYYFPKWYKYENLLGECKVVAAARRNDDYVDMLEFANDIGRVKVLNLPVTEVSSTEIREKLLSGEDISGLVPGAVAEFIAEKGLYKND